MDGWAGQAYRMPAGCKDLISIPAGEPARKRRSLTLRIAPRQGASEISKKRTAAPGAGPSRWWGWRTRPAPPRPGGGRVSGPQAGELLLRRRRIVASVVRVA